MKHYIRTSPPAQDPVSSTEAIGFLRGAGAGSDEETLVTSLIAAARDVIEHFTGRSLMEGEWLMAANVWGGREITLDRTPLVSVESIKYWPADGGSQVTLSGSDYLVITATTPGRIQLVNDLPALADRADAVQVAFTAGAESAADVPAMLIHALRLLVVHLYENRQPLQIGNIVAELPWSLRHILEAQRVGGWCA